MAEKNYDIALVGVNLSEVPNLYALLTKEGNLCFNNYSNDTMDSLLANAGAAKSESELKQIYSEIQLHIVDRLPIMGLVFRSGSVLASRSLGGLSGLRTFDTFNGIEFLN